MKRKLAVIAGLVGLFFALSGAAIVHAQNVGTRVDPNQTINGSFYSSGRELIIQGTINGDVYCVGQNVLITATVHGDVLCTAQQILISGQVDGNVRVAAVTATLNGTVGHSASFFGQAITVNPSATIGQDLTLSGSAALLKGNVGRDVISAAKNTQIAGVVGRNLNMMGNELHLQQRARVVGDLTYRTPKQAAVAAGAEVKGQTHYTAVPLKRASTALFGIFSITVFPMLLVFGLLIVALAPQAMHKLSGYPTDRLFRTLLVGIAFNLALPLVVGLLVFSVVGTLAAIFVVLVWVMMALLSGVIMAYYIGRQIVSHLWARQQNALMIMLIGSLVLLLLFILPEVGILVASVAYVIGCGSITRAAIQTLKKRPPKYRVKF
ncbi:MAG TPA: polymer-forming cytoskeletal protein [Candidatus Saccharimonadales bacterium]|nr:polymer-forming cytoskeletal protein [Candidatus Saccharimonadales bacterium]